MATRLKKIKHIVTIDNEKYSLTAPDIYDEVGASIGIVKAPTPDSTAYKGKIKTADFGDGKVIKVKSRGKVFDNNGAVTNSRIFTFVVPMEKVRAGLAAIESKKVTVNNTTYDLGEAYIPRRRRFF